MAHFEQVAARGTAIHYLKQAKLAWTTVDALEPRIVTHGQKSFPRLCGNRMRQLFRDIRNTYPSQLRFERIEQLSAGQTVSFHRSLKSSRYRSIVSTRRLKRKALRNDQSEMKTRVRSTKPVRNKTFARQIPSNSRQKTALPDQRPHLHCNGPRTHLEAKCPARGSCPQQAFSHRIKKNLNEK
jgi:hypothetical protein